MFPLPYGVPIPLTAWLSPTGGDLLPHHRSLFHGGEQALTLAGYFLHRWPAGRRTDYSIRSALFYTSTFSTSLRSHPQPQTNPHSSHHTHICQYPGTSAQRGRRGFITWNKSNLIESRDSHGRQGDQDRDEAGLTRGFRYCAQSHLSNGAT